MTAKELIELLQQLPDDTQICLGKYDGEPSLSSNDVIVYHERTPITIIIPGYEWVNEGKYMRLDEYLKERINKD